MSLKIWCWFNQYFWKGPDQSSLPPDNRNLGWPLGKTGARYERGGLIVERFAIHSVRASLELRASLIVHVSLIVPAPCAMRAPRASSIYQVEWEKRLFLVKISTFDPLICCFCLTDPLIASSLLAKIACFGPSLSKIILEIARYWCRTVFGQFCAIFKYTCKMAAWAPKWTNFENLISEIPRNFCFGTRKWKYKYCLKFGFYIEFLLTPSAFSLRGVQIAE